ncbi:PEP/pyruvate-binding domain-containing protein [Microbispora bryophytorum]|uniref:PEP/pyruvate-binding domain-containing protein n=1 Tax=Microbispora bryophytorum TaxID=1460882 RepID=UPI0033DC55BC
MKAVIPLADTGADLATVGGKGASLAALARAGLPVPGGFHITTEAYRAFAADFREETLAAAAAGDAERIAALFAGRELPEPIAAEIRAAYAALGDDVPVAVRSSATAEDLPGMSFAGQQDTFLNVRADGLLDAVKRCWASLWNSRAIAYREQNGVPHGDVALAVVVQELVDADAAGVMFTADPVTGARDRTVINASWGLGEAVVGGHVIPDTVVVSGAAVVEERTGDKTVMTVRIPGGTREEPVPEDMRRAPVLSRAQALALAELGARVQALYGTPMDVEWTMRAGTFALVQARPITASGSRVEEWNDSLKGDHLWTSGNLGEAIPDVMTPITWSFVRLFINEAMSAATMPGFDLVGNIGGRFYMNLSIAVSVARALGMGSRLGAIEQVFGKLPPGLDVPPLGMSRWQIITSVVPLAVRRRRRVKASLGGMRAFLSTSLERCEELRAAIRSTSSAPELAGLWSRAVEPHFRTASRMLEAAGRQGGGTLVFTRGRLRTLVGETDADAILTGAGGEGELASLGLITGLGRLASGEITREIFARLYGHRGPHEFEVSVPRPGEDPAWIDAQLAALRDIRDGADELLARQREARQEAWARFARRHPRKEAAMRARVERWAGVVRDREATRSEVVRAFWVLRAFVLRADELTGHGDDLFHLYLDELLAVLGGDATPLERVPVRRATYEMYAALPPYPTLIVGRFDPVRWAADPGRRADIYDARGAVPPAVDAVTGFPGAPGVVEGVARVIARPEDGDRLRPGEILVTMLTNVGWTPLFPRAAAVVTDVGAPLSHASIVARELGIPAVVGTGNATTRVRDGDRIRVDGARGTVELVGPP